MMFARIRPVAFMIGLALFSSGFGPPRLAATAGPCAPGNRGDYDIAVFTEPSPFVAGPVDISVLLLNRDTGRPIKDARVSVEVSPEGRPARTTHHLATEQAATNKLLRAAVFELRDVGRCEVTVSIEGPNYHAQIQFELNVGSSWSPRIGVWPWILWPVPVIVLYRIHRRLVDKSIRRG